MINQLLWNLFANNYNSIEQYLLDMIQSLSDNFIEFKELFVHS